MTYIVNIWLLKLSYRLLNCKFKRGFDTGLLPKGSQENNLTPQAGADPEFPIGGNSNPRSRGH